MNKIDSTNLYLAFKSLYLKSFDNIKISSDFTKDKAKDKVIQALKDE
jgi:hypothetical protein